MPFLLILAAIGAVWLFGWPDFLTRTTYRAEVGYYQGGSQTWYVGSDKSYDDCISEARAQYNFYNSGSPNRAFSWACRKMQGETFVERVR